MLSVFSLFSLFFQNKKSFIKRVKNRPLGLVRFMFLKPQITLFWCYLKLILVL